MGFGVLVTIPLALLGLVLAVRQVPSGLAESDTPVDNYGGALSALMVGALVVALNIVAAPNLQVLALILIGVAVLIAVLFVMRQRRAPNPLYDLNVARRPTFWVAAVAGIIIFGSPMCVLFVNQQYLQNVLGNSSLAAGAAILPAVALMVLIAPLSARLVVWPGARAAPCSPASRSWVSRLWRCSCCGARTPRT